MMQLLRPLPVRSMVEACYFLMVQHCTGCGKGPLEARSARREFHEGRPCRCITADCRACRARCTFLFDVSACPDDEEPSTRGLDPVGGSTPSRIVDVSQWLMLFQTIIRAADRSKDKSEIRRLGFEAAQCLDEALKFYTSDDQLPDEDAFLSRDAYDLSRSQPEHFARSRLLSHRDKLPSLDLMRRRLKETEEPGSPRRSWWRGGKDRR